MGKPASKVTHGVSEVLWSIRIKMLQEQVHRWSDQVRVIIDHDIPFLVWHQIECQFQARDKL